MTDEQRRTALVVVDAQVGVLASVARADEVTRNIEQLVHRARDRGTPVVWVQHADDELVHGSAAWALAPPLVPLPTETVVHKHFNSSFADTELARVLAELGASRIVLAGAATNWCIRATAYAALERGFHLGIASDAHSTESMQLPEGREIAAASVIDDFNTVMRWIRYPNVEVDVRTAANIPL